MASIFSLAQTNMLSKAWTGALTTGLTAAVDYTVMTEAFKASKPDAKNRPAPSLLQRWL